MPEDFDFEINRIVATIRDRGARKVLLQFPEGLKRKAAQVASTIEGQTGAFIVISGEPCFGACDLPATDADLVVHFGHLPIPCLANHKSVLYIQARSGADPIPVLEKALPGLPDSVGLLTTAQHLHVLVDMMEFLKGHGKKVLVGKGDGRLFAEGQVLGCNASVARNVGGKVDAFLFVGTGNFHALAVALATTKPVLIADPVNNEVRDVSELKDRVLRKRLAAIERAKGVRNFGILVSTKPGQRRERLARHCAGLLAGAGYSPVTVDVGLVTADKLNAFGMDAWVSTACPRLAIDDNAAYDWPILTPVELEILLGKRAWDDYAFDEILETQ